MSRLCRKRVWLHSRDRVVNCGDGRLRALFTVHGRRATARGGVRHQNTNKGVADQKGIRIPQVSLACNSQVPDEERRPRNAAPRLPCWWSEWAAESPSVTVSLAVEMPLFSSAPGRTEGVRQVTYTPTRSGSVTGYVTISRDITNTTSFAMPTSFLSVRTDSQASAFVEMNRNNQLAPHGQLADITTTDPTLLRKESRAEASHRSTRD